eukprot:3416360-Alexandrium_andersonii.AAC.1
MCIRDRLKPGVSDSRLFRAVGSADRSGVPGPQLPRAGFVANYPGDGSLHGSLFVRCGKQHRKSARANTGATRRNPGQSSFDGSQYWRDLA